METFPNPFTLPVHPAFVHFPLAMLTVAWACLMARWITGDPRWDERSKMFETVGVVTLPVVIVTAIIDLRGFEPIFQPRWEDPLIWHAIVGLAATTVIASHYLWRRRAAGTQISVVVDVTLSTAGLWLLLLTGLIAAEMVYGK